MAMFIPLMRTCLLLGLQMQASDAVVLQSLETAAIPIEGTHAIVALLKEAIPAGSMDILPDRKTRIFQN